MSDYTLKNFKDADDFAQERGFGDKMEVRFMRKHLGTRDLGVSLFSYKPGARIPFGHRHREQEEAYVVVRGSGRVKLDDEIVELAEGDVMRVAPEVTRAFEGGPDGMDLICVGGPRPEGGDGEPAPDFWTD